MGRVVKCSIIIYDDFNNVLIAQRGKVKKGLPEVWSIFGKEIKGKETEEKCINKTVDKDLKCTIFDLNPFKEYVIDEETGDTLFIYTGRIREQVVCHKEINKVKWIGARELENYEFSAGEKEVIADFFSSKK